jgi:hypothetical protein
MPLVFVLFYRGAGVKATCEARDPTPRWTDRCPLPVLALSVMLAWGALSFLVSAPIAIVPFFGRYLTGPPGALIMSALGGVFAWLAYGVFRLMPVAWWASVALSCIGTISAAVTFARVDMMEFMLSTMPFPEESAMALQMFDFGGGMVWQTVGFGAGFIVYILCLRRYFQPQAPATVLT